MCGKENWFAVKNTFTPYVSTELYEKIDTEILLDSVKKSLKYHPLFETKIIFDNGMFYFEENPNPPIIFDVNSAPKTYGCASNNYYPWLFVVDKNRLIFYTIHALTDVVGMLSFIKTVLHIYFEELGVIFHDKKTDFPHGTPLQTIENSYSKYADFDNKMFGLPLFDTPTEIDSNLVQNSKNGPWKLTIPNEAIKKRATESETSFFAVISCLLSRAMSKAYNIKTGNIGVRVPVSLRRSFPSITDRNFVQSLTLYYLADYMNNLPDETVETAFRSQLDLLTDKSNLTEILNNDVNTLDKLKSGSEQLNFMLNHKDITELRANILYSHVTNIDFSEELLNKISDIYIATPNIAEGFVSAYGITAKSSTNLIIEDQSKNNSYIQALKEILNSRNVRYIIDKIELAPNCSCVKTSSLINKSE